MLPATIGASMMMAAALWEPLAADAAHVALSGTALAERPGVKDAN